MGVRNLTQTELVRPGRSAAPVPPEGLVDKPTVATRSTTARNSPCTEPTCATTSRDASSSHRCANARLSLRQRRRLCLTIAVRTVARLGTLMLLALLVSCRGGGQYADDVARIASREASSTDDVSRAIDDVASQTGQAKEDLARQWREGVSRPIVPTIQSSAQTEDVGMVIVRAALCSVAEEAARTRTIPSAESVGQAAFENLLAENIPRARAQSLAADVEAVMEPLETGDAGSALFELQLLLLKNRYC